MAGGAGILLYLWLWALVPLDPPTSDEEPTVRADLDATREALTHLAAQIRIWLAPLLPPAEAHATLAEARALAESGNRTRLLEQITLLELKMEN